MINYPTIIFAALLTFLYGLISRASETSPITAATVFAGVGILAGPLGCVSLRSNIFSGLLDIRPGHFCCH